MLSRAKLQQALGLIGELLADRGQRYEVAAIGGGGLLLLGLVERTTTDFDLVGMTVGGALVTADPVPLELATAANEVGDTLGLQRGWLNAVASNLLRLGLPPGFVERTALRETRVGSAAPPAHAARVTQRSRLDSHAR